MSGLLTAPACIGLPWPGRSSPSSSKACWTWENRLVHQRMAIQGLFGPQWVRVPMRTSNAYRFYDYRRDAFGRPVDLLSSPKSQNSTGTTSQENQKLAHEQAERGASTPLDPSQPLEAALLRLGQAMVRA